MDQSKIGSFIAKKRREKGLTQAQLAEVLGVTGKSVSKWETGRGLPDVALFEELCAALGITLNELFAGEEIPAGQETRKAEESLLDMAAAEERRRKGVSLWAEPLLLGGVLGTGVSVMLAANAAGTGRTVQGLLCIGISLAVTLLRGWLGKRDAAWVRRVALGLLAACVLAAADLGMNYAYALMSADYMDGLTRWGFLHSMIWPDYGWSVPGYFAAFCGALQAASGALLGNGVLWLAAKRRKTL